SRKAALAASPTKLSTNTICKAKRGLRADARLLRKKPIGYGAVVALQTRHSMREKKSSSLGGRKVPPRSRRRLAGNGERAAIHGRSEIDRFWSLGKATRVRCDDGDRVDACRRDPPQGRHAGTRTS